MNKSIVLEVEIEILGSAVEVDVKVSISGSNTVATREEPAEQVEITIESITRLINDLPVDLTEMFDDDEYSNLEDMIREELESSEY